MLIRPPSLQKPYDNFYWRDPAFIQPPEAPGENATDEEIAAHKKALPEHLERIKSARETGRWDLVTLEGKAPTKFLMRPLPGIVARKIADRVISGVLGMAEAKSLAFRIALLGVENFGEFSMKWVNHAEFGKIAHEDIGDLFDALDPGIVTDLGGDAIDRARGPSPN